MQRIGLIVWPAAIGLGVAAESVAFSWDDPRRWLPDLIVGLTFIGCGFVAWAHRGNRGVGALLAATGVAWFLGNFDDALLYLHRGPLVHLLLTYAGWRPRARRDLVAVVAGYAAAIATPVWQSEAANIVIGLALVAVAAYGYATAVGRARRERLVALQASAALAVVLVGGAAARLASPAGDAADPALLAYQAVLCGIAVSLLVRLGGPATSAVADLVVELGEAPPGTLRERLASVLGDSTLDVGYWSVEAGAYIDDAGETVVLPETGAPRSATLVEREGVPFAVLVHDAAVLGDPALVEAVAAATRLSESNAALQAEVRAQVVELTASRRRLLATADEERMRLEARLHGGPVRRLVSLGETLDRLPAHTNGQTGENVERARGQLARTLEDLHELAGGLHPRELTEAGLEGALASLAERAPVPVQLAVRTDGLTAELEATVYFLCAESLANVAKYSSASRVAVSVEDHDGHLAVVIADDGVGGADASRGTGLQGLADRVEALGGTLHVASPPGSGTRLSAEIPLGLAAG